MVHTLTSVDRVDAALREVRSALLDAHDEPHRVVHREVMDRLLDERQAMVDQVTS